MTTPLRVLLVDDEELSRLRLRTLLADCVDPAAQVVGEAATAAAALHWLALHAADVVLLDIRMPGMDGLALAARLRAMPQPPRVIFVTAHAEHALAAFEVEAVDYLTKPVRRLRLQEALARVAQRLGGALPATAPAPLAEPAPAVPVAALERRRWSDERGEAEASEVWAVRIAATDEWLAVSRRQLASVRDLLAAEGL